MATYARGMRIPEASDPNAVPADMLALVDTIVPAMSTAEIDALSWARKPAGWLAFDTTRSRLVRSTGAAMVEVVDGASGTTSRTDTNAGFNVSASGSGKSASIGFRTGASGRWFVGKTAGAESDGNAGSDFLIWAYDDAGADLGEALRIVRASRRVLLGRQTLPGDADDTVVTKGYADVARARVVGGVLSGTTDAAANIALVLPALPSGATGWSLSVHKIGLGEVVINNVAGSLASLKVPEAISAAVTIHWQAVAY